MAWGVVSAEWPLVSLLFVALLEGVLSLQNAGHIADSTAE
jgi:hypothetical protein